MHTKTPRAAMPAHAITLSLTIMLSLAMAALLALSLGLFILAGHEVHLHAQRWQQQLDRIEAARQAGETAVTLEPVPSRSRYTMSIPLEQEPDLWPNRTLSRWFGLDIHGSAGPK